MSTFIGVPYRVIMRVRLKFCAFLLRHKLQVRLGMADTLMAAVHQWFWQLFQNFTSCLPFRFNEIHLCESKLKEMMQILLAKSISSKGCLKGNI